MVIFMFMSMRWVKYREPLIETHSYKEDLTSDHPVMKKLRAKGDTEESKYRYFRLVKVTTTVESGTFPFLQETKRDTIFNMWKTRIKR